MSFLNRRSFLRFLSLTVPFLGGTALAVDDQKPKSQNTLPPGHPPREGIGRVNVTPDMIVTLTASAGGVDFFSAKAKDFQLSLYRMPNKRKLAVDLPVLGVKDLGKLPAGEFSLDGRFLSDLDGAYEVRLELDEAHSPGIDHAAIRAYQDLIRKALETNGVGPGLKLKVDDGRSIWFENVQCFNPKAVNGSKAGQKWKGLLIHSKTAVMLP